MQKKREGGERFNEAQHTVKKPCHRFLPHDRAACLIPPVHTRTNRHTHTQPSLSLSLALSPFNPSTVNHTASAAHTAELASMPPSAARYGPNSAVPHARLGPASVAARAAARSAAHAA